VSQLPGETVAGGVSGAVVGLGRIGAAWGSPEGLTRANYASALRSSDLARLLFGIDSNGSRRHIFEECYEVPAFASATEAITRLGRPDFWIVSTPTPSLVEVARQIMRVDPHARLLVEKPLAYDTEAIAACASWPQDRIRVGYTRAFLVSTLLLRSMIESAPLGALISVEGRYSRGFANNASHLLDLVQRLFGFGSIDISSSVHSSAWCPSGDVSRYVFGSVTPALHPRRAKLQLEPLDRPNETVASLRMHYETGEVDYLDLGRLIDITAGNMSIRMESEMDDAIGTVVDELARWSAGEPSRGCTLEEALATSRLVSQVMES
jgi:predicted dehydrogenase